MINKLLIAYQSLDQINISGHANLQQLTNAMDVLGEIINSLKEEAIDTQNIDVAE